MTTTTMTTTTTTTTTTAKKILQHKCMTIGIQRKWNGKTKVIMVKGKRVKFTLQQAMKACRGKKMYSSILSLTLALDGSGWAMPHPGCFMPRKVTQYSLYRRLGGPSASLDGHGKSRPTGI